MKGIFYPRLLMVPRVHSPLTLPHSFPVLNVLLSLSAGRRVRYRALDDVLAQLEAYACDPDIQRVFFTDPEFNVPDLAYSTSSLNAIVERGLNDRFRFSSQFQPHPMTAEFAQLLHTAGFSDLCLSVDSIDELDMRRNGKRYRRQDIEAGILNCISAQVPILVDFILGMVGETKDTVARTLEFADRKH